MGSITKAIIYCLLILTVLIIGCKSPYVSSANIYLDQQKNADKAEEVLLQALQQNPNDPEAHFLMGRVHLMKGRYQEMIASFDRSLELSSKFENRINDICMDQWHGFYSKAVDHFNERDYEAALDNLNTADMIYPVRYETYLLMGMIYEHEEDWESATESYQYAVEKNTGKKNLNLYYNLANSLFRMDKWEESLEYAQVVADEATADSLFDLQMDAVKICAVSLSNLGRPSEALEIYNDIIIASPNDPNPVFDRALLYIDLGDTAQAIEDFEYVISMNPEDIDALKQLGWFYLEGGTFNDYAKALDYYQRAYALDPDQYIINRGVGIALVRLERVDEAQEYLERAKELK